MKNYLFLSILFFLPFHLIGQETMEIPCFKQEFATGYITPNGEARSGQLQEIGRDYNLGFGSFDLSSVPNGAKIESAVIQFYRQGGFTSVGSSGNATFTYLEHLPFEKKPTINDVYSGTVLADDVDWTVSSPPVFGNVNAQGLEILNSKIGSSFSVGIYPPTTTPNRKTIAGYNSTLINAPAPLITITYTLEEAKKPSSDFVADEPNPYAGNNVNFTDKSGNYPTSWLWEFGDGNTSSLKNPSHIYALPGKYSVTLTATNEHGSTSVTKADYINVAERLPAPVSGFDYDTNYAEIGGTIYFYDTSQNNPTQWAWYFGDYDTSYVQNPSIQFNNAGIYSVTLIATSEWGSDTIVKPNLVQIGAVGEKPQSNFGYLPVDLKVDFFDSSINSPNQWLWDFESEKNPNLFTSTEQNPTHIYENEGTYKPCLTASNKNGNHKVCKEITVSAPKTPVSDFEFELMQGLTVKFTDKSINNPTLWNWSFGQDQGTSDQQHPQYEFPEEGNYLVSLIVGNDVGSGYSSKNVNVIILSSTADKFKGISLYPNPIVDHLNIQGDFNGTVQIINMVGEVVVEINIRENSSKINLCHLANGNYTFRLIEDGVSLGSVKIIKNN